MSFESLLEKLGDKFPNIEKCDSYERAESRCLCSKTDFEFLKHNLRDFV